jgi:hypothetical protein
MHTASSTKVAMTGRSAGAKLASPRTPAGSALAAFEQIYLGNVDVVTAYFARRCAEPQTVADLTSETFVRGAGTFGSFAHLERMTWPPDKRSRLTRPQLLVSSTVGLAGVGTALALALSAASSSPAFAVTRNADGTITVRITRIAGIAGANA